MHSTVARTLSRMGYDSCPAARDEALGLRPAAPISADRLKRRFERKRRTPDAIRAETRATILLNARLLANPEQAWQRGQLEQNRRHHLLRYRLQLAKMIAEPRPELPSEGSHDLREAA